MTGPLSDRIGRKGLIAAGMLVQAVGIWLTVLVPQYSAWLLGAALQGLGTAMVYPTLLAVIGDVCSPFVASHQLRCLSTLARSWLSDRRAAGRPRGGWLGMGAAIHVVAALTLLSGLVVLSVMRETLKR